MNLPNVIFFAVKQTEKKLLKICTLAALHLQNKEPLLILLSDKTAYDFVDDLLWKLPKESFIPHPSSFLHLSLETTFEAPFLLNLRSTAYLEPKNFKTIYELEDSTSSDRAQLSKQRYLAYRQAGHSISIQEV